MSNSFNLLAFWVSIFLNQQAINSPGEQRTMTKLVAPALERGIWQWIRVPSRANRSYFAFEHI